MSNGSENILFKKKIYFFQFLIIALLIFYLPVLLNHFYYRDDWHRATEEFANFRPFGRVFGSYFLHFLSSDYQVLTETTPLFQLVSIVLIAASVLYALKIRNISPTPLTTITVMAFLFNPFFIESLLYRYDGLVMTIAMMSGVLAWASFPKKPVVSALFVILSLGTYQPFANIFILLAIGEFTYQLFKGEKIKTSLIMLFRVCLVYCIALIIYRLAIIPAYSVKTARSALIPFDAEGLSLLIEKIKITLSIYPGFLSLTGKIIYALACVLAFIGMIRLCQKNKCQKIALRLFLALFVLLLAFPLSYGPFLLLLDGAIGPRILSPMIIFSMVVLFYASYFLLKSFKKWVFYLFATLYLLCPLSFSYMANNALANQEDFEDFISKDTASEIFRNYPNNEVVLIDGNLPYAPLVNGSVERYKGIQNVVVAAPAWVSQLRLQSLGVKNIVFEWQPKKTQAMRDEICANKVQPDITTQYSKFYTRDNKLFIWLGEQPICLN